MRQGCTACWTAQAGGGASARGAACREHLEKPARLVESPAADDHPRLGSFLATVARAAILIPTPAEPTCPPLARWLRPSACHLRVCIAQPYTRANPGPRGANGHGSPDPLHPGRVPRA